MTTSLSKLKFLGLTLLRAALLLAVSAVRSVVSAVLVTGGGAISGIAVDLVFYRLNPGVPFWLVGAVVAFAAHIWSEAQ